LNTTTNTTEAISPTGNSHGSIHVFIAGEGYARPDVVTSGSRINAPMPK
jgi:hypothetical protein